MYVDQETTQDDEENNRTGTNQAPSEGTDVRLLKRLCLEILLRKIGSTNDMCDVTTTVYSSSFIRCQSSTGILCKKSVNE
jgi:hypothetical protein